uniref:protein-serine/threonine phosphatase n=1 Tax=Physcomitrium patens TaxID=3218 RepID=A0A7I4FAN9_PHYPA
MSGYNSVFNPSQPEPSVPINGGGLSENKKFSYGFSSLRGKRASMEDFHDTKISKVDGIIVGLFGVFDGHGGSRAAVYVKQNLFKNLLEHPQFVTDTKVAIAIALSTDHKPNRSDERQRIEKAGGVVMWSGTWRVGGVLAVSRAFGDRLLKKYVVAEPEIQDQLITSDVEFLVLASDGLWDVVSNQDAVTMVQNVQDAQEAAKRLTDEAYKKGSADNITCVVIRFHHNF